MSTNRLRARLRHFHFLRVAATADGWQDKKMSKDESQKQSQKTNTNPDANADADGSKTPATPPPKSVDPDSVGFWEWVRNNGHSRPRDCSWME